MKFSNVNGLCLITGINLSGKNSVADRLQDKWASEYPETSPRFLPSGSQLMIQHAGLAGYHELRALDVSTRLKIREETFKHIVDLSQREPVFFLTHFALEDGEMLDHSTLAPATRVAISVVAKPEIVLERGMKDPDLHNHPGRMRIVEGGVPFVERYMGNDMRGTFDFARDASRYGSETQVLIVHNDTLDQQCDIAPELLHDIFGAFSGEGMRSGVEGQLIAQFPINQRL